MKKLLLVLTTTLGLVALTVVFGDTIVHAAPWNAPPPGGGCRPYWQPGGWTPGRWHPGYWEPARWIPGGWRHGQWFGGRWTGPFWHNGWWQPGQWREGGWQFPRGCRVPGRRW